MNFRPTLIKLPLSIVIGLIVGFYFKDNCLNCSVDVAYHELIIGFVPAFLWIYGLTSLFQLREGSSRKIWHYIIVLPLVIIIPYLVGLFLEGVFS